jgi:dGTPase
MENMVESALNAFMHNYEQIMAGTYRGELLNDGDENVSQGLKEAKFLAREEVFPDTRKTELEVGAYSSLGVLLESFCKAVHEQHFQQSQSLSYRSEKILSLMGIHAPKADWSLYHSYMRVLDFISGMTDNYAAYLSRQIGGISGST